MKGQTQPNSREFKAISKKSSENSLLIGLLGQPNVGKSTVFNRLTGLNQHVGNWPGKTVECREGIFSRNGVKLHLYDLPGTYSLTVNSTEEGIARDFILKQRPDVVVMVANASALERSLYLLAELLMLPVPVVLGLNMIDVAKAQGIQVEPHVLQAALGLPVVPLTAAKNEGTQELLGAIESLARDFGRFQPSRPEIGPSLQSVLKRLSVLIEEHVASPYPRDWVALKLLEGDSEITDKAKTWFPEDTWYRVEALLAQHEDAILDIAGNRYEWIGRMVRAAVVRPRLGQISLTDHLDRVAAHPLWGLLILLTVLGLVFWITFTVAAPIQAWLDEAVIHRLQGWLAGELAGVPAWLRDFVTDGLLGGAGIVLTFLPLLVIFFTVLALLESTGYLARVAFVMDRFMHMMGLHGRSFLPLFLGFGCNVPAVMGARIIESSSGRLLTILLAPLVPCSARLLVLAFLTPAFFGKQAILVSWGLVALNILVLVVAGGLLKRVLFGDHRIAFMMELPLYHLPQWRSVGFFVWNHTWAFLRKAGSIILLVALLVWALGYFPGAGIEQSYLAWFGKSLAPLGQLMGMDWRLLVALLSSFVAKENAIVTLGILYGEELQGTGLAATLAALIAPASALAFLTTVMLFIPCAATLATVHQETGGWRWTLFSTVLLLAISLSAGIIVYQGACWLGIGIGHA